MPGVFIDPPLIRMLPARQILWQLAGASNFKLAACPAL
jgi:hypothetical protein